MAALQEMLDEQARIKAELQRMEENEETTEEGSADLRDTLVARFKELDGRTAPIIARMEEVKGIIHSKDVPGNAERTSPDLVVRTKRDPFEDLDSVRKGVITRSEAIGRANDAIEMEAKRSNLDHDRAETAVKRIQDTPSIARHVLMTGSPEYQAAFRAYLEDPQGEVHRAAMSLTLANGGYLLPYVLDPTIVLTNQGSKNPYRAISSVKQTTSNSWNGVTSAGVTAAWLAEGAAAADASPSFGNIVITPVKGSAWVFGSFEMRDDTDITTQLPGLLSDAKDRLEEAAFAVGTGTAQPLGVLTSLPAGQRVAAANGTGGAFTGTGAQPASDVYNLQAKLGPRFRGPGTSSAWVGNLANINKIRAIDQSGGSSFWANFTQGQPPTLLGDPIYESTSITTSSATGTGTASAALVYGDFSQFYIVDRVGTSLIYDPIIKGTGASANLPTGQAGWFYYWRTSSGVSTTAAFAWLANGS